MTDDRDRTAVQTYVPSGQHELWKDEAEELDMSRAEYVRTMVQAGRRSFELNVEDDLQSVNEGQTSSPTPGVGGFKEQVLKILRRSEFPDWDELLAEVTNEVEDRLESALDELQSADRIKYSGRHGGYSVIDDER